MMTTENNSTRKRKQEFIEPKSMNTAWTDFVYSSPNSPGYNNYDYDLYHHQQQQQQQQQLQERRHSVTVGEMHFHSFNLDGNNNSLPSSWSSSNSSSTEQPMVHRRAMSLRIDNSNNNSFVQERNNSISTASPTTPAFFSPSFLDALKGDDNNDLLYTEHHDLINDFMLQQQQQQHQQQQGTIAPSDINPSDELNWLLNQPIMPPTNIQPMQQKPKRKSSSSSSISSSSTSSSMNTTPPPVQQQQQLANQLDASIPEEQEDEELFGMKNNKQIDITNRIIQGNNNATMMKSIVEKYLKTGENERKVVIYTSKVAQKSYGTEKRFLCPPPSTVLSGADGWWTRNNATTFSPPSLVVHISGEKTSQNGVIEWYNSNNGTLLDHTTAAMSTDDMTGKCVSKHLHINDADEKRKRVEVLVKINLANGNYLGTLASKGIKVISKPSKKRQSVKNMELCIHHGTTISLFNRIRSQTVSTKYLGVSTNGVEKSNNNTCFVARTGSWDPFVIWIVDTTRSPEQQQQQPSGNFPAPPAIALQNTNGPVALHYNQSIVLQCVSTGLVSPVMVIRKVDKGSMILGGNRLEDLSGLTGGECGDEALGDPVSQLHKIAFQIVQDPFIANHNKQNYHLNPALDTPEWTLPQISQPVTYLACLNDVVGMHKTTTERSFISQRPQLHTQGEWQDQFDNYDILSSVVSQQENGKITRKRRVSCDIKPNSLPKFNTSTNAAKNRRRVNSLNDVNLKDAGHPRRQSISDRRHSLDLLNQANGACWTEDVSDASVWTIVGTDSASYKFWTPSSPIAELNSPFNQQAIPSAPITPYPTFTSQHTSNKSILNITGENFSRDITVWFGDIRSKTDYKSRDSLSCIIPDTQQLLESSCCNDQHRIPLLFVRGDGVIYNPDMFYNF